MGDLREKIVNIFCKWSENETAESVADSILAILPQMPELRWNDERNFLFLANLFVGYVGCVDSNYWCGYVASDDYGEADNVIDGAISQEEARAAVEKAVRKALGWEMDSECAAEG